MSMLVILPQGKETSERKGNRNQKEDDFREAMQGCEADSRCTPFGQKRNRLLCRLSPFGWYETASVALPERRFRQESGRRGLNPRQPAWKAGCHILAARLPRTGF